MVKCTRFGHLSSGLTRQLYDRNRHLFFARKVIRLSRISLEEAENELRAMSKLYGKQVHENLVESLGNGSLSPFLHYIDMELCDGNLDEMVLAHPIRSRYCPAFAIKCPKID